MLDTLFGPVFNIADPPSPSRHVFEMLEPKKRVKHKLVKKCSKKYSPSDQGPKQRVWHRLGSFISLPPTPAL